jgi:hypothetical protein
MCSLLFWLLLLLLGLSGLDQLHGPVKGIIIALFKVTGNESYDHTGPRGIFRFGELLDELHLAGLGFGIPDAVLGSIAKLSLDPTGCSKCGGCTKSLGCLHDGDWIPCQQTFGHDTNRGPFRKRANVFANKHLHSILDVGFERLPIALLGHLKQVDFK